MAISPELLYGRELSCKISACLRRGSLDPAALAAVLEALDPQRSAPGSEIAAENFLPPEFYTSQASYLIPRIPETARAAPSWCGFATAADSAGRFFLKVAADGNSVMRAALSFAAWYRLDQEQARPWPPIFLTADYALGNRQAGAKQAAQKIVTTLAEAGLWGRPLHLWIGSPLVLDCLSPYCRDLREVLLRWAESHLELIGADLPPYLESPGEQVLYAIAHDFLATDPALVQERAAAECAVGISRFSSAPGLGFDLVDLGRIDQNAVDARLSRWRLPSPAPVLLRMDEVASDVEGAVLEELLDLLGAPPVSVTCLAHCDRAAVNEGTIIAPCDVICFESGECLSARQSSGFLPQDFLAARENEVDSGALLATAAAAFLSPQHLAAIAQQEKIRAVYESDAGHLKALVRRLTLPPAEASTSLAWAVVASSTTATGRAGAAGLAGLAWATVTRLQQLFAGKDYSRAAAKILAPERKAPGRTMRIKA